MDVTSTMSSLPSVSGRWDGKDGLSLPAAPESRSLEVSLAPVDNDDAHASWSCRRKKQYPSLEIADKIAAKINASSGEERVRSYGCRHCGQFHVGAIPGVPRAQYFPPRKQQRRVVSSRGSYGSARRRRKKERYRNHDEEEYD